MTVRRIFHVQLGRDGGTERFFVTLAQAFAERGIEQGFAIRPGRGWRHEIERLGEVHEGTYLRRTPGSLLALWRMRRAMRRFAPDVAMAWRAPAARLIPDLRDTVKIVRLGDYPPSRPPFPPSRRGRLQQPLHRTPYRGASAGLVLRRSFPISRAR